MPVTKLDKNVVKPSHYTDSKIEVIDYIEDKKLGFNLGNVVKYISRAGKKGRNTRKQDLEKALWYLVRELRNELGDAIELDKVINSIRIQMTWHDTPKLDLSEVAEKPLQVNSMDCEVTQN